MSAAPLKKGDIVIRAYAHDPVEWGVVVEFETVNVDPQQDDSINDGFSVEYVYATVLWPDGYTTQEADYELWTPEEAFEYSEKRIKEIEDENLQEDN